MRSSRTLAGFIGLTAVLASLATLACGRKPAEEPAASTQKPAAAAAAPKPATGKVESRSVTLGGLHVDDGGTGGVPVVFVHSYAGSSLHWQVPLSELRRSRRAVAFDLPGHGRSPAPAAGAVSVEDLARSIGTVVDGLELPRFVLVGHSLGGSAAIAYAAENPDRVAGLVLVATPGRTPPAEAQRILASLEADYDKVMADYWRKLLTGAQPSTRNQLERERQALPKDRSLSLIRASFAFDPLPALAKYPGAKLLLDTPQSDGPNSLAKLEPKLKRRVIKEASHWPQLDKPMRFSRVLARVIQPMK